MAVIPLFERAVDFTTEQGHPFRAVRAYVTIELFSVDGSTVERDAILDCAAPLSVMPYTLWQDEHLAWRPLGSQLARTDRPDPGALSWQGVSCVLGETTVRLLDAATETRTSALRLRAKFPVAKIPARSEKEPILGLDFLLTNPVTLALRGGDGRFDGVLLVD